MNAQKNRPEGRFFYGLRRVLHNFDQIADLAVERNAHFQQQRTVIADDFVFIIVIYNLIPDSCTLTQLIPRYAALVQYLFQA